MIFRNNKVGAWLHVPRPLTQPALRLFAFPYAGATGSAYHAWAQALPSGIELCGIQMPGRHARIHEPSCTRLEPLVDALVSVFVECADAPMRRSSATVTVWGRYWPLRSPVNCRGELTRCPAS